MNGFNCTVNARCVVPSRPNDVARSAVASVRRSQARYEMMASRVGELGRVPSFYSLSWDQLVGFEFSNSTDIRDTRHDIATHGAQGVCLESHLHVSPTFSSHPVFVTRARTQSGTGMGHYGTPARPLVRHPLLFQRAGDGCAPLMTGGVNAPCRDYMCMMFPSAFNTSTFIV
jgi:hypothetical protein